MVGRGGAPGLAELVRRHGLPGLGLGGPLWGVPRGGSPPGAKESFWSQIGFAQTAAAAKWLAQASSSRLFADSNFDKK